MDRSDKDNVEQENRNEDPITYNSQTSDWPFCSANLTSMPMNLVAPGNSSAVCKENVMGSSASVVDSFATTLWDHPTNLQNIGYCDINVQSSLGTLSTLGCGKGGPPSLRSDVNWNPSVSMLKEVLFLPNGPGTMPESLTQFPADSGFIERAARFSCFNGGNFSNMVNPFGIHESMGLYPGGVGMRIPDPREVFPGGQPQRSDVSVSEGPKDVVLCNKQGASEGSPLKNDGRSESIARSHDEGRQVVVGSGNESDEAEFSGGGAGQDDPSAFEGTEQEVPAKGLSSKKRKRNGPVVDAESDAKLGPQPSENGKDSNETQARIDQTPNSLLGKATGKNSKQGSQASDPPKEEYIHVRARRGQATNSHSLAERVRREKISERMKFLQDLVPGCSKVTGKAVMLDEIINYVQSLQRQVEFLSMKLATVNPRLEFNLEGLLTKDLLQSRPGPSSTLGFFPELPMVYPPVHPPASLIQGGLSAAGNPDAMRRPIHSQLVPLAGGLKESSQLPNMWEDELNHVVQMGFPGSATPSSQEVDASEQPGHTKVEL